MPPATASTSCADTEIVADRRIDRRHAGGLWSAALERLGMNFDFPVMTDFVVHVAEQPPTVFIAHIDPRVP